MILFGVIPTMLALAAIVAMLVYALHRGKL